VGITYKTTSSKSSCHSPGIADLQGANPGQPQHQTGLRGRLPQLQPEPQPAADLYHGIPAPTAATRPHRSGLSAPTCRQPVLPGPPGLTVQRPRCTQHPCETKTGQNAPRLRRCAKAMKTTSRSTMGTTGRATPTRPRLVKPSRNYPRAQAGSTALPPPPIAVAQYDPTTGTYVGPDGKTYTQANLARVPPTPNMAGHAAAAQGTVTTPSTNTSTWAWTTSTATS